MSKFAFLFPGQGSQALDMLNDLIANPIIQNTFKQAKEVLGIDYLAMLKTETPELINQTINTQPLLLTTNHALYLLWGEYSKQKPDFVAGHSLGEYNALIAAKVIDFETGLKLVKKRATYMQEAVPVGAGSMAAVLGLADEVVINICQDLTSQNNGVVAGVNFNAPGQVVIAGNKDLVDLAIVELKHQGARKVMLLPVSVPAHSLLMQGASEKLAEDLAQIEFNSPAIKIIQNVNALVSDNSTDIKNNLIKQLYSPVLWTNTINKLKDFEVNILVECGPGKVLSGLNKRINREAATYALNTMAQINELSSILA